MRKVSMSVLALFSFMVAVPAWADMAQLKAYKEAHPGAAAKCLTCHQTAMPKKAAGEHELNEYGKKAVAASKTPTAETYKQIGAAS